LPLRVSVSGVRGIVGDGLDAVVAARWASAFGMWLPDGPVVVGRDTRPSGPMIAHAVAAGLMSTGHPVWDIGVATTPTCEVAVAGSEAVGGVIVTASHNPQPWNALKFVQAEGLFLTRDQNAALGKLEQRLRMVGPEGLQKDRPAHRRWDALGTWQPRQGADRQHLDSILQLPWLDRERIGRRSLHAVVDAVEGAGGRILPQLLSALGVRCTPLFCDLTGLFPHDPEPTPANLTALCARVTEVGADLGLAVDPDGDRLALVDGAGRALSEELTLVLAVDFLLGHQKGPVVVNLSTTRLIDEVAGRHGAAVSRTPVGEANVVETMLVQQAVIGGEGNGGVIYPAVHAGRDALVGVAMILQAMAQRSSTLAELADELPPVAMVKEKAGAEELPSGDDLAATLTRLGPGTLDNRDGLKWTGQHGWVHVRPSNTEPIVRIIAEAATASQARELIARVRAAARV
jgi:phosphomannomutase